MSEFTADPGPVDRARLGAHLAESRRLMTAPLERMDRCMFRLPAAEVVIETPVTRAADAIAAAAGRPGLLRVQLPPLSRQDQYVVSGWLEAARDRIAGRGWNLGDNEVAHAVERIRLAFDAEYNVTGEPGERFHLRTPGAWKAPARPAWPRWAQAYEEA